MENLQPLHIAGRNVKWCSCFGRQFGRSSKVKYRVTIWLSNSTPSYILKRNEDIHLHKNFYIQFLFSFKFIYLFIYFIFGCVGSSLLCVGFLWLQQAGATLHCSAWASHCSGFSCCGARALGAQASVVVTCGLSSCGTRALERRLSSCGAWA